MAKIHFRFCTQYIGNRMVVAVTRASPHISVPAIAGYPLIQINRRSIRFRRMMSSLLVVRNDLSFLTDIAASVYWQ